MAGDIAPGLEPALREFISNHFIAEGPLFGCLDQAAIPAPDRQILLRVGWVRHDYHDRPVVEPPAADVSWKALGNRYRDITLQSIAHKMPGQSWEGNRMAILEEVLDSSFEARREEIQTWLHAWTFASLWNGNPEAGPALQDQQTFFFYTANMRETALKAIAEAIEAPPPDDEFWDYVAALLEA